MDELPSLQPLTVEQKKPSLGSRGIQRQSLFSSSYSVLCDNENDRLVSSSYAYYRPGGVDQRYRLTRERHLLSVRPSAQLRHHHHHNNNNNINNNNNNFTKEFCIADSRTNFDNEMNFNLSKDIVLHKPPPFMTNGQVRLTSTSLRQPVPLSTSSSSSSSVAAAAAATTLLTSNQRIKENPFGLFHRRNETLKSSKGNKNSNNSSSIRYSINKFPLMNNSTASTSLKKIKCVVDDGNSSIYSSTNGFIEEDNNNDDDEDDDDEIDEFVDEDDDQLDDALDDDDDDENASQSLTSALDDLKLDLNKIPLFDKPGVNGKSNNLSTSTSTTTTTAAGATSNTINHGKNISLPCQSRNVKPQFVNSQFEWKDETGRYAPLVPSLFPLMPPVLRFVPESQQVQLLPKAHRKYLKWRLSNITPLVVKRTIARSGFSITKKSKEWLGYFGKHMKSPGFKTILEHQKINHFPGTFQLGRKDRLWRNLWRQRCLHGHEEYGFFPQTYCLPTDWRQIKNIFEDAEAAGIKQKWIVKPPASARGQGVKVISKLSQIPRKKPVIVQQYIARPYLINGSKFDLRVYVYVSSFDPLRIYVHDQGLVRFASQQYSFSSKNLNNRFMHLTNYSVNKKNSEYASNDDGGLCQGHKWTLNSLWGYLGERGIDCNKIWASIKEVIVKTIISAEASINSMVKMYVRRRACVHELFGFDILLDSELKPWVLEVNISPSLHSNSPLDVEVKSAMISDMFNLAGFQIPPRQNLLKPSASAVNMTSSNSSSNLIQSKEISRTVPSSPVNRLRASSGVSMVSTAAAQTKLLKSRASTVSLRMRRTTAGGVGSGGGGASGQISNGSFDKNLQETMRRMPSTCNDNNDNDDDNTSSSNSLDNCGIFADLRLWDKVLSPDEKAKHVYYNTLKAGEKIGFSSILDKLTTDDVRILCESVDEWARAGSFERIFPLPGPAGVKYLRFCQANNRYYNYLLHTFLTEYQSQPLSGINLLATLCYQGVHLVRSPENDAWKQPS